jgi:type VI secretion system secreted protein Hcp
LTLWRLQFFAQGNTGVEQEVYRIELTNASIASMRESMVDNETPANASLPLREELTFTYQKITWTWMNPTIVAQDDWETPVS